MKIHLELNQFPRRKFVIQLKMCSLNEEESSINWDIRCFLFNFVKSKITTKTNKFKIKYKSSEWLKYWNAPENIRSRSTFVFIVSLALEKVRFCCILNGSTEQNRIVLALFSQLWKKKFVVDFIRMKRNFKVLSKWRCSNERIENNVRRFCESAFCFVINSRAILCCDRFLWWI